MRSQRRCGAAYLREDPLPCQSVLDRKTGHTGRTGAVTIPHHIPFGIAVRIFMIICALKANPLRKSLQLYMKEYSGKMIIQFPCMEIVDN